MIKAIFLILCVALSFTLSAQVPLNDECIGATLLEANADNSCSKIHNADIKGATQSLEPCTYTGYEAKDVWYKFVATSPTHTITLTPESFTDFVLQAYSGSCSSLASITCIDNSGISEIEAGTLTGLTVGDTYFIRIYSRFAWADLKFQLCINSSVKAIANDECSGALAIATTGYAINRFTNIGATLSMPACTGIAENDVWFKFTATSNKHVINANTIGYIDHYVAIELFSGSCDNLVSLKCYSLNDESLYINTLTPGKVYYYRVYIRDGSPVKTDFNTYVSTPITPDNDECENAIALTVNSDNLCTISYNADVKNATQSMPPCVNSGLEAKDVWYKFVASAPTHTITINPESFTDFAIEVFNGNCGALTSIVCVNNTSVNEIESGTVSGLVPGATYLIRVFSIFAWPDIKFRLCVNSNTKPITNDECEGAIERPSNDYNSDMAKFTNIGATLSMPACAGSADNDIWFKFVATSNRHVIRTSTESVSTPPVIETFSGSCSNLTSLKCYNLLDGSSDINGLAVGNTYYYRLYLHDGNAIKTDFNTYVVAGAPKAANDECSEAVALLVNNDNSCKIFYDANVQGATQSITPCVNSGYEAKDAWYKFVASSESHTITITPESFTDFVFEVYDGSCGNLSSILCADNTIINEVESGTVNKLVSGKTYFVRVYSRYAWADFKFRICINSNVKAIVNDECAGAIDIPTTGYAINKFTNLGATLSMPTCFGTGDNDIWFKFTATQARHIVSANTAGFVDYPVVIEIFSGTCDGLTSLKCYSMEDGAADIANLTPGNTYYYRIYPKSVDDARTDFNTYVSTPILVPIKLVSFAGKNSGSKNLLYWQTTAETDIAGFEIQASTNGAYFETIGFVKQQARTAALYNFEHRVDTLDYHESVYYRLKQIDKDGDLSFSDVVLITSKANNINIYPNPTVNFLYIKKGFANNANFTITDVSGKRIIVGKISGTRIDVSTLSHGTFFLKINDGEYENRVFLFYKL
jgi:hypothetical protein